MADDGTLSRAIAREHIARTRTGLGPTALGALACALLLQLVRHKTPVHWVVTAMVLVLGAIAGGFAIWSRPDRTLSAIGRLAMGIAIALTALSAIAYLGVVSAITIVLCAIVYSYGASDWPLEAWIVYLVCAIGYVALAALSLTGALPLTQSVLALKTENQRALLGMTLFIELVLALTFWFAWRGRRFTLQALADVAEARLEAGRRGALLLEAREDLRQAVHAARLGRLTGQTVDGFVVGDVIGRGAMGEVYAATRETGGEPIAVKVLHPHLVDSSAEVERFLRELRATKAVDSPHVVKIVRAGAAPDGSPYLAMEWLVGSDLATLLRQHGRLPLRDTIELVRQVAAGLAAAHAAGIVHRDIKPQNVFRAESDSGIVWKVLDFGVSRFVDLTSSLTQGAIGTPSYMSPEQCQGKPVDQRADVFALALLAYRALTGQPAFSGGDHFSVIHRIVYEQPVRPSELCMLPTDVDLAIAIGLAKDRDRRFESAPALAEALAAAAHNALRDELRSRARVLISELAWSSAHEPSA